MTFRLVYHDVRRVCWASWMKVARGDDGSPLPLRFSGTCLGEVGGQEVLFYGV